MIDSTHPLLLGSSSPRRREFVEQLNLPYRIFGPDIDERVLKGEDPCAYVERMARNKMDAVFSHPKTGSIPFAAILTADTVVVKEEQILTKPESEQEATSMLTQLCGDMHHVISAYCLYAEHSGRTRMRSVATEVQFRKASAEEIARYVATGEGRDKAGAYAIQGVGAYLVEAIRGSYTNVVGLPLCELVVDLKEMALLDQYP